VNGIEVSGGRLREVRKRSGLTQRELAQLSWLPVSLVRKLEQGACSDVRLETVHRLAVVLRVPAWALGTLRAGLDRVIFLLGGSDGKHLPGPSPQR
jgi:transcriptional regulator with XRE-family HTH domain